MPVQEGLSNTAGEVLDLARAILNDLPENPGDQPAVFTDAKLLPFLNSAYRRWQKDLATAGVHHLRTQASIIVPAGTTQLDDGVSNGLLPAEFLHPIQLLERPAGSTDRATEIQDCPTGLPQRAPQAKLEWYVEQAGMLMLIGATQDLEVLLQYERQLLAITSAADPIRIKGSTDALACRCAMGAARSRGLSQLIQDLRVQYEEEKALWLAEYWRPKQNNPARRRPYGSRRRIPYA